jgi:hypothetical protein
LIRTVDRRRAAGDCVDEIAQLKFEAVRIVFWLDRDGGKRALLIFKERERLQTDRSFRSVNRRIIQFPSEILTLRNVIREVPGKGIITMKTGDKTGRVVGALTVTDNDELMLITTKGQMVRTRVKEIRAVGRNTMGVKLMDLRGAEKLQAIAPVVSQAIEEAEVEAAPAE